MLITNITKGQHRTNLIIRSLKVEKDDEDYSLAPGQSLDTEMEGIPDRKVDKSNELKKYVKDGAIKIIRDISEESPEERKKIQDASMQEQKQAYLDDLAGTSSLDKLQIAVEQSKDPDVVKVAKQRLVDLTGSEGPDNPEVAKGYNNPRV